MSPLAALQITSPELVLKYTPTGGSDEEIWRLGGISTQAMRVAHADAISMEAYTILPEHILAGILSVAGDLLSYINPQHMLTPNEVYKELKDTYKTPITKPPPASEPVMVTAETLQVFEQAVSKARNLNAPYVYVEHLLLSLCKTTQQLTKLLNRHGFTTVGINEALKQRKREELLRFSKIETDAGYDDYQLTGKIFIGRNARYKLLRFVKIGGMGAVYAALRFPLGVTNIPEKLTDALDHLPLHIYPACIKYLKPEVIAKSKDSFIKEISIMENLIHPNIIRTFDSGETNEGRLFYAMEWVNGISLEERLDQSDLTLEEALFILEQICNALHYAHQRPVYHLDIKPANVMLLQSAGKTVQAKLIDFGLAKVATEAGMTTTLTRVGGTPPYIAPEVLFGRASQKSDVFSLGVMLCHMLTRTMSLGLTYEYAKRNPKARLPALPSITNRRHDLPPEIDGVIAKAHQRNPRNRQKTALEFLVDFKRALGLTEEDAPTPAIMPEPERVYAEIRQLLEGAEYDRSVLATRDPFARQMIAAELLSALAGRNARRRVSAAAAFVEQGYFEETARDLHEADAPAERAAAARSLAFLGDRAATPHLIAALEDQNLDVRRAAVEALGALRDPSAVGPLEALLERERSERNRIPPRVIRSAAETCREAAAEAVPAIDSGLIEIKPFEKIGIETAPEPSDGVNAGEWFDLDLGEIHSREQSAASAPPESIPISVQQRLASGDTAERAAAIVELSRVDTDEAFQQICAGFDDNSKEVRGAAARALYDLRPERADSFTRALREASPARRRAIGAAISSSGLAVESISQLTGESRERTLEAFSLLFLMAKAGEVQPLVRAIESHPSNEVRLAVVKLLALSGQKEILPAFRRLAVRGSLPTEVRSAVMEAIYQISSSQPTHA